MTPEIMKTFDTSLPIDEALPRLTAALAANNSAVLVAPPGAGKTTRVPLVLLDEPWAKDKKILVLEPRRLAARAAASRMASTLGEQVGDTVGLRVRFGSKISKRTRIEVVTEGVFTHRLLRPRRKWPCSRRAAYKRYELAPLHVRPQVQEAVS